MIADKTICHKITQCFEILERASRTGTLDLPRIAKLLHEARDDAQNMENHLRYRKEAMTKAGIEEKYQKEVKGRETQPGINKIANTPKETKIVDKRPKYELTVTQDGEVIYKVKTHAGIFAAVERFDDMDKEGNITGQSQQFYFGHPLLIFYTFNQIEKGMEDYKLPMMRAFRDAMKDRDDVDPSVKEALREAAALLEE